MKTINTLAELKAANLPEVYKLLERESIIALMEEGESDAPSEGKYTFAECVGGALYLLENANELRLVYNVEFTNGADQPPQKVSVLEAVLHADNAEWVGKDDAYAILFFATNNAGGPLYIIPKEIAATCPNVSATIQLFQGE